MLQHKLEAYAHITHAGTKTHIETLATTDTQTPAQIHGLMENTPGCLT